MAAATTWAAFQKPAISSVPTGYQLACNSPLRRINQTACRIKHHTPATAALILTVTQCRPANNICVQTYGLIHNIYYAVSLKR